MLIWKVFQKGFCESKMDSKKVVSLVEGLNSQRTLSRWRGMAEMLAGVKFKQVTAYQYDYTDDDVSRFQIIANWKEELSLEQAVLKAFGVEREYSLSVEERLVKLEERFRKLIVYLEDDKKQLEYEKQLVNKKLFILEKRLVEMFENPRIMKLLRK